MDTWGHDKILSDVVWVIRKFQPDVIITRFPGDERAGHGHHAASSLLANEAFKAAADPNMFPEQLQNGIKPWQAKRILWNTFNFGTVNTTDSTQFKIDVGVYNSLLGKGYGEIASESRSQHKSQGFGVPAQRGESFEYFKTIKGTAPDKDLMDGVFTGWSRTANDHVPDIIAAGIKNEIDKITSNFSVTNPENSLKDLVALYESLDKITDVYWREQKKEQIKKLIELCSGLFMEATAASQYAVQGDTLKVTMTVNNRSGANIINADAQIDTTYVIFDQLQKNTNAVKTYNWYIDTKFRPMQPYWLENEMEKGSFTVIDQNFIGKAENDPISVTFSMMIEGREFTFKKPVRYKYTDPVKGEIYQPVINVPYAEIKTDKSVYILKPGEALPLQVKITPHLSLKDSFNLVAAVGKNLKVDGVLINKEKFTGLEKDKPKFFTLKTDVPNLGSGELQGLAAAINLGHLESDNLSLIKSFKTIVYDHIPSITYFKPASFTVLQLDVKTLGTLAGYIPGAGDKIPEALEQMGYKVVTLKESDITAEKLRQFDVIITGVRAYNTNEWMNNVYDVLMQYVKEGGVLVSQYNTSNQIGPVRAKIAPYPFTITRNRITDEEAKVNFLLPQHRVLNYPNKITAKDFEGWIQERSIYNAENTDTAYKKIFSMKDPGESEQDGSLIIANYGQGRFVYTGLVFFRELPAGVPGAYRLFANIIANKRQADNTPKKSDKKNEKINVPSKFNRKGARN